MIAALFDSKWFPLVYVLLLGASIFLGAQIAGRWVMLKTDYEKWLNNNLSGAVLSFFSLLLAFTLSASAGSNKERTVLIHRHTDAIGALYRKSFLYSDSLRAGVKRYALEALALKIQAAQLHGDARRQIDSQSFWHNEHYLKAVSALARQQPDAALREETRDITDAVQQIIELDSTIHYSNQERTPLMVMLLLLMGSLMTGFVIGLGKYHFQPRRYIGPFLYLLLSGLTVLTIQDMDNPHTGLVRPPYEIYRTVWQEINQE